MIADKKALVKKFEDQKRKAELAALAAAKAADPPAPQMPNPEKKKLAEANSKIAAMLEADEAEAEAKKEKKALIEPGQGAAIAEAAEAAFD